MPNFGFDLRTAMLDRHAVKDRLWTNPVANVTGGILFGYGIAAFACFFGLDQMWFAAAPHKPDPSLGLIFQHNEHGDYRYFTAFQATAAICLPISAILTGFIGWLIAPKKNIASHFGKVSFSMKFDSDDPKGLSNYALALGILLAPFFIFVVGPTLVDALLYLAPP
jgi:hypothetical protein